VNDKDLSQEYLLRAQEELCPKGKRPESKEEFRRPAKLKTFSIFSPFELKYYDTYIL
jgi:hypothetical protein